MTERLRAQDERYSKVISPSSKEQKFRDENPKPDWIQLLNHILDNYPQKLWRLEGGAAIGLYHPGRRVVDDIDIFTPDPKFAEQFGLPPWKIDVRTTEDWLKYRDLPVTDRNLDYLMSAHVAVAFGDKRVLLSSPNLLAFSKLHTYDLKGPRQKDLQDLALLAEYPTGVKPKDIEKVHQRLKAA